ncbi:hypothetical protein [Nostoc sp. CALU 546]|uniref:hypothetical protein n=1 Tax=Nostoc sp. CALU 546 TaxID=1867241 RepID=UPI003B670CAA
METSLPPIDQLLIRRFKNARDRGLLAARRGDIVSSERFFAAARVPLQLDMFSLEGKLLYKCCVDQSEAYLDYRRGDFDRARKLTAEALELNVVLEEEYGYGILHLHAIELVRNFVRIYTRCMCFDRAIELAYQILCYLEGTLDILPIPGLWDYERVVRQPPELVAVMFAEVTGDVALILAGKKRQIDHGLFALTSANMQLQVNDNCHWHPPSYAWLLVKQAFVLNDIPTFLERASTFLAKGRADTPLLWYATVIDLVALCDELDFTNSELFRQEVCTDAATWKFLPQKFSCLLGVHPKTEAA